MLAVVKDMETVSFKDKATSANMGNRKTQPLSIPKHIVPQVTLTVNLVHPQVTYLLLRQLLTSTSSL